MARCIIATEELQRSYPADKYRTLEALLMCYSRATLVPCPPHAPLPAALDYRRATPASIVRDKNGQALAYVYFEDEPGRRSAAKLLTRHEARRIAAKPPDRLTPQGAHRIEYRAGENHR